MRTFFKTAFALYLCYHLAAVFSVLIPTGSQLKRAVNPVFSTYMTATGNKQHWSMFTTIPYHHRHNVVLEVADARSKRIETGILLPDLAPYDETYFRYHSLFARMLKTTYKRYLRAYVSGAKEQLESRDGSKIKAATLLLRFGRIQNKSKIRRTGKISKEKVIKKGPFRWP